MTVKEALQKAKRELRENNISEPEASAEVLLSNVLGVDRTRLSTEADRILKSKEEKKISSYIQKRLKHEPVWQIIGKVDFWGMQFLVTKDVLVPRPETELLIQEVLSATKTYSLTPKTFLDVGTGAGTIAITLASEFPTAQVYASDISAEALKIAKKNNHLLRSRRVVLKMGDLFEPWEGKRFDVITANLPYIPHEDMESLQFDVLHHEPRVALDGGHKGIEIYERFFQDMGKYLNPSGMAFCELGINQGGIFKALVNKHLPTTPIQILGDLAGIDRIALVGPIDTRDLK